MNESLILSLCSIVIISMLIINIWDPQNKFLKVNGIYCSLSNLKGKGTSVAFSLFVFFL